MNEKLKCNKCGKEILPATSERTGGLCIHCYGLASAGKETLLLLCEGCGRKYNLGENAMVTTPGEVMSRVGGWLGGSPNAMLYADIISPLEKPVPLNDKELRKEQEVIRTLQEAMRIGSSRKWRCFKCGREQKDTPVPIWR